MQMINTLFQNSEFCNIMANSSFFKSMMIPFVYEQIKKNRKIMSVIYSTEILIRYQKKMLKEKKENSVKFSNYG